MIGDKINKLGKLFKTKQQNTNLQPTIKMIPYTCLFDLFFTENPIDPLDYGNIMVDALEIFNIDHHYHANLYNVEDIQDKNLLRPLSRRQIVCYSAVIVALQCEDFLTAFHETRDCIHDYREYRNKEFISLNEYFLFKEMFYRFNIKWKEVHGTELLVREEI